MADEIKWMTSKPLKCNRCRAVVRHNIGCHYPDGEETFVQECMRCREITTIPER